MLQISLFLSSTQKKNNMKKIWMIGILFLGFISCKKEDTQKPVISITAPANGKHFEPGETFTVTGTITDNENLSQFKIDMHSGDGHMHKSTKGEFDFELIQDIEGTSYSISVPITITADADSGLYHLIVEATDEAGNQADFVELDIEIHKH